MRSRVGAVVTLVVCCFIAFAVAVCGYDDVSLAPNYQELARRHMPTLVHEQDTRYFPVAVDFDSNLNASDNYLHYSTSNERFVYIHILRDASYVYVQYWYYYVYNPFEISIGDYEIVEPHSQDWELVVVVLDDTEKPVGMKFGAHGPMWPLLGITAWSSISKTSSGTRHPFAYVYAGSHAAGAAPSTPPPWLGEQWSSGSPHYTTWKSVVKRGNYCFIGDELGRSGSVSELSYCPALGGSSTVSLPAFYESYSAPWLREIWMNPLASNYGGASACESVAAVENALLGFWEIDQTLAKAYGEGAEASRAGAYNAAIYAYTTVTSLNQLLADTAFEASAVLQLAGFVNVSQAVSNAACAYTSSPYLQHSELWIDGLKSRQSGKRTTKISEGNTLFARRNDALGVLFDAIYQAEREMLAVCSAFEIHPWSH